MNKRTHLTPKEMEAELLSVGDKYPHLCVLDEGFKLGHVLLAGSLGLFLGLAAVILYLEYAR